MAASSPGEKHEDALSDGRDTSRPSSPLLLVGVVAVSLVAGYFLGGGQTDLLKRRDPTGGASLVRPVVAGAIERVGDGVRTGSEFALPVFNTGANEVEATIVSVDGLAARLSTTTTPIAPGTWELVPFAAPADCNDTILEYFIAVRLRIDSESAEAYEGDVALPDKGATALLEYHNAVCPPLVSVQPNELAGVWLVEKIYGSDTDLEDALLVRFDPGGTFVADHEGGLFSGRQDVWGTYRLEEALLTTEVEGGVACSPGEGATWRAATYHDNRLSLAWVRGTCPNDGHGDLWILRRLLLDAGLPTRAPGVVPAQP